MSDTRAPAAARSLVTQVLSECVTSDVLDTAKLLVTELVTNSLQHATSDDLMVEIDREPPMLRLTVTDQDETALAPESDNGGDAGEAEAGRGLSLVSALSRQWGTSPIPGGKKVWCELPTVTS